MRVQPRSRKAHRLARGDKWEREPGILGLPVPDLPIALPVPIPAIPIISPVVTLLVAGSTDKPLPLPQILPPLPIPLPSVLPIPLSLPSVIPLPLPIPTVIPLPLPTVIDLPLPTAIPLPIPSAVPLPLPSEIPLPIPPVIPISVPPILPAPPPPSPSPAQPTQTSNNPPPLVPLPLYPSPSPIPGTPPTSPPPPETPPSNPQPVPSNNNLVPGTNQASGPALPPPSTTGVSQPNAASPEPVDPAGAPTPSNAQPVPSNNDLGSGTNQTPGPGLLPPSTTTWVSQPNAAPPEPVNPDGTPIITSSTLTASPSGQTLTSGNVLGANLGVHDGKVLLTDFNDAVVTGEAGATPVIKTINGQVTTILVPKGASGIPTDAASPGNTGSPNNPSAVAQAGKLRFIALIIALVILAIILLGLAAFFVRRRSRARRNQNIRRWWFSRNRNPQVYDDHTPPASPSRTSWSSFATTVDRSNAPSPFNHRNVTPPPLPVMTDISHARLTVRVPTPARSLSSLQEIASTTSTISYFTASESPNQSVILHSIDEKSLSPFVKSPSFASNLNCTPSHSTLQQSQTDMPSSFFRVTKVPIPPIPPLPKSPPPVPYGDPFIDDDPFEDRANVRIT